MKFVIVEQLEIFRCVLPRVRLWSVSPRSTAPSVLVTFLEPDRPEWKPLIDSRRIVGTVLMPEDIFTVIIPPDQLVQKGGYNDVKEAVEDIIRRHKQIAAEKAKAKQKKVRT